MADMQCECGAAAPEGWGGDRGILGDYVCAECRVIGRHVVDIRPELDGELAGSVVLRRRADGSHTLVLTMPLPGEAGETPMGAAESAALAQIVHRRMTLRPIDFTDGNLFLFNKTTVRFVFEVGPPRDVDEPGLPLRAPCPTCKARAGQPCEFERGIPDRIEAARDYEQPGNPGEGVAVHTARVRAALTSIAVVP